MHSLRRGLRTLTPTQTAMLQMALAVGRMEGDATERAQDGDAKEEAEDGDATEHARGALSAETTEPPTKKYEDDPES